MTLLLLFKTSEAAIPPEVGVIVSGTHARPSLVLGRIRRQLIPVEYTFWLKAGLLRNVVTHYGLKSVLILDIREKLAKLTSNLLRETKLSLPLKASIVTRIKETRIKLQSSMLVMTRGAFRIIAETKNTKLKKVLLRKLKEFLDE